MANEIEPSDDDLRLALEREARKVRVLGLGPTGVAELLVKLGDLEEAVSEGRVQVPHRPLVDDLDAHEGMLEDKRRGFYNGTKSSPAPGSDGYPYQFDYSLKDE